MSPLTKRNKVLENIVVFVTGLPMAFIMSLLFIESLLRSYDVNADNAMQENVFECYDDVLLNIAVMVLALLAITLLLRRCKDGGVNMYILCLFVWTIAIGFIWILTSQSAPTHDSLIVTSGAYQASSGNFDEIKQPYFIKYPYQLGYVFFSELIIRLFALSGNYLLIECINVVFLAIAYVAIMFTVKRIFDSVRTQKLTAVLLALCIQPIMFCSFLYGNIPSFSMAVIAVWLMVAFLQEHKWYTGVLSAVSIGVAVCIKPNSMIIFAAMMIITVFIAVQDKKMLLRRVVYIALSAVMVLGIKAAVIKQYELRADVTYGSGVPMISFAAMGMTDETLLPPGWFNDRYTGSNFVTNHNDAAAAADMSIEVIKKRADVMLSDLSYTRQFYARKLFSQWNEASYQSIWTNQVRGQYGEKTFIAAFVCGNGEHATKTYMNLYQLLIFLGTAVAIFCLLRRRESLGMIYPLIILGGVSYHLIFEAKSQYALVYFILMVPLAAYGINALCERFDGKIKIPARRKKANAPEQDLVV